MTRFRNTALILGSAGLAMLTTSVAGTAATLIPIVPVMGSTSTGAFGINDNDTIVGAWLDASGIEHGFFGTLAGIYTTFDYTGNTALGTEPRSINDSNLITGWGPTDGSGNYVYGPQFEYNGVTGTMRTITEGKNNPVDGIAQGINRAGEFAGDHWVYNKDGTYTRYGYLGKKGKWLQDLLIFGSNRVAARSVNKSGVVVGYFTGSDGFHHGFILQNGVATQVDFPDASEQDTYLEGLNDKGLVVGGWNDANGNSYAFKLDTTTSTFTSIKIKGATFVSLWGPNDAGLFAVSSDVGNFIYCPRKPSRCPGSGHEVADERSVTVPAITTGQRARRPQS